MPVRCPRCKTLDFWKEVNREMGRQLAAAEERIKDLEDEVAIFRRGFRSLAGERDGQDTGTTVRSRRPDAA